MPSLQNKVMSVLIAKHKKTNVVPMVWVKLIYANTLPGSPLRRFIVDFAAYKVDMAIVTGSTSGKRWSHEALLDLLKVVAAKDKKHVGMFVLPAAILDRCYYHIHADGENCDTKL
jgi:hypothetical protein